MIYSTSIGNPHPLGATPDEHGVNFSFFSMYAEGMELLLFDDDDVVEPFQTIILDPDENTSFHFWHVYVKGLRPGAFYAIRVGGPFNPGQGHRFNRNKVLVDPYANGVTNTLWDRGAACGPEDNLKTSLRGVVIDRKHYDWDGDEPLGLAMNDSVIYELHVKGFTRDSSSGVQFPGTFKGLAERIPYLKDLGVTTVELLPVLEFDATESVRNHPRTGQPLANYWGYSTVNFFAPHSGYTVDPKGGNHLAEFRDMVKAFHAAGIEVILDVVFNHTSEGNHLGPTINFRGFENSIYYHLVPQDQQYYMDYSGCGNTFNCNHPLSEKFITDCLEFWVQEMHVDGFRFDEGTILCRGLDGAPLRHPPVVWSIDLMEVLSRAKIIAEAWDANGLYEVGSFPGFRWAEWNGRFRDTMRKFVKGVPGIIGEVAARIAGSADLYEYSGHLPLNTVNFITCHDGFTMNDLVSYNEKHNWDNGEDNRDGINENESWNCGAEGPTADQGIETLRSQQVKNMAALLLLSQGVPMILGGDEVRRTQCGNNNAYCQDNELSWMDWSFVERYADVHRFFKEMISLRKATASMRRKKFFNGSLNERGLPDISWHGTTLNAPGWNDPSAQALAFTLAGRNSDPDLHVMMNMYHQPLEFDVPSIPGSIWKLKANTSMPAPRDIFGPGQEPSWSGDKFLVGGRSIVVLLAQPTK